MPFAEILLDTDGPLARITLNNPSKINALSTRMVGEIYILAVDPAYQRQGVATTLMQFAMGKMREAGMAIVMVETGDDPGHSSSRATYENAGFDRWPVARYFRKL